MKPLSVLLLALACFASVRGEDDAGGAMPLVGYTELRTNLPGGRHANVRTSRAMVVRLDGSGRRAAAPDLARGPNEWTQFAGWSPRGDVAIIHEGWQDPQNALWEEANTTFRMESGKWRLDSWLVDMDTGTATNVTAVERVSHYNGGVFFLPAVEGGDGRLGFTPLMGGKARPFVMDLDGRNKRDVSGQGEGFAYGYSASPDGKRISYHEDYQIYVADADGSNKTKIETGHQFNFAPRWSSDGEWLLFVSGVRGKSNPYVVRSDGTDLRKLADLGGYQGWILFLDVPDFHEGSSDVPVWSASGTSVFYTAKVEQNVELFEVAIDGEPTRLTHTPPGTLHYHPTASPDGKWLLYGSKRSGVRQLFAMSLVDRSERQLTQLVEGQAAMWPHWQPIASLLPEAASAPLDEHGTSTRDIPPPTVHLENAAPPPAWALRQRFLFEHLWTAAQEFVAKYTRPDGSLIWRERWPGMDGSDDGYESFYNFPLYYVLGGPAEMHNLSHKLWDAVTRQFTGYGQVHNEFDAYYDWMHHGESYVCFYFFGLADPLDQKTRERAIRFAGMYMGEDPSAPNWDAERKLIRSPINGSRGPRFVNSAEDWVTHRPVLAHYPLPYDDIPGVAASSAWVDDEKFPLILHALNDRMMRGDVPLNLTATSLITNAYLYTGEEKYKRWIVEYVEAWTERARVNGGILPDNVGLSGEVGEYTGGKWWGGYYGWKWPHGFFNLLEATTIAGSNALLVSGDDRHLQLARSQIDVVLKHSRVESGRRLVPHKHDERGWYAFRQLDPECPTKIWCLTREAEDWERVEKVADVSSWARATYSKAKGDSKNEEGWVSFLRGENPTYPEDILEATYRESLRRLAVIRADTSTPPEQDVHHWQQRNPVILEGLVQLTTGGPNHIYHGGLLHSEIRHFDPHGKRPGLPDDVAVLVDKVTDAGLEAVFVNIHPSAERQVLVQAGAYGEHRFDTVNASGQEEVRVGGTHVTIVLAPGALGRVRFQMARFVNTPSYKFPWH